MSSVSQNINPGKRPIWKEIFDKIGEATEVMKSAELTGDMETANESAFSDGQLRMIQEIASNTDLTDAQKNDYYASLVSDNYSDENKTVEYNDGTKVDVSEMTVLQKTKLDGKFRTKDYNGVAFDSFGKDAEVGDTKEVCGGTLTYKGQGDWGESIDVDDKAWHSTRDYIAVTDEQRGTIVHYEGVLGSFTYNTREFELSYYEAEQNGNTISVPVLHYIGDKGYDVIGDFSDDTVKIKKGSKIHIPEGLEIGDYMFADCSLTSMPDLTECDSLKSAHCMFLNCESMDDAAGKALDNNGNIKYPPNLEDISWIFAGSAMTQFFGELGEKTMDARCAAQDCTELGHVPGNGAEAQGECSFMMPDLSKARYLVGTYCDDMFDNTNTDVQKVVEAYCENNEDNPGHISAWSDEEGAHNNIYDKINDGSYDVDRINMIRNEAAKKVVLQQIDPTSNGMTGTESETDGFMTTAVQLTDGGNIQDSSTWSSLRQTDKTYTSTENNEFGEILDRGVAFAGTYGLLSAVTKNKWISLAGAAVPQIVGFGHKLTPILDTVADWLGEDSKIGGFLSDISEKLKDKTVSYHTKVEDLDIDEVFADQQDASVRFARNQVNAMLVPENIESLYDSDAHVIGAAYDVSEAMYNNGVNLANDGNLITIALTSEQLLENTLNTTLMSTAMDGLSGNLREDIEANGGVLSDALKREYSSYFITLSNNLKAYSDGGMDTINEKYIVDIDNKNKAINGLEKVMRNTCEPVYKVMRELQDEYGLFTEEQLNVLDKNTTQGMPSFTDYKLNMELTPVSDVYVEAHEQNKSILKAALESATTEVDYQNAYNTYYENSYGYLMDEAEKHSVNISTDKSEEANAVVPKNVERNLERIIAADSIVEKSTDSNPQSEY